MTAKVQKVIGREILDSRGFPTVECTLELDNGTKATACVPSGASTGTHEALELRDGGTRYLGKGVLKAVENVNKVIGPAILGTSIDSLKETDTKILATDGTENKSKLGANAILAVSLAAAHASALNQKKSLAQWINEQAKEIGYNCTMSLPIPLMNVINGGAHADNGLDIQEFMIVPHGFSKFSEALRAGSEVFHHLKKILSSRGLTTAVGDEGGFAPRLNGNEEALKVLMEAIEKAGYQAKDQISLALDVASTEFYSNGVYKFRDAELGEVKSEQLIEYYEKLSEKYPIISIEDAMSEDDWAAWSMLNSKLGARVQLVGDDLYVTQVKRLQQGISEKSSNAILIKLNQVGSLLETLETMKLASENAMRSVVSHRSGETEDTTLAHLVVGTGAGQVKTGSLSRSDRVAKYNQLLRLEDELACPFATVPGLEGKSNG